LQQSFFINEFILLFDFINSNTANSNTAQDTNATQVTY